MAIVRIPLPLRRQCQFKHCPGTELFKGRSVAVFRHPVLVDGAMVVRSSSTRLRASQGEPE